MAILIGLLMGLAAFFVDWGIQVLNRTKFSTVREAIYTSDSAGEVFRHDKRTHCYKSYAVQNKTNSLFFFPTLNTENGGNAFLFPYTLQILLSLGFAFIAASIVAFEPLAAGSGIAEIKTYLNGVHIKGLLTLRTLIAKLLGVTFSIGAGLIAGKEGPFVHGGGIVGGGVGSMGSLSLTEVMML